jgi:hypothetical protein
VLAQDSKGNRIDKNVTLRLIVVRNDVEEGMKKSMRVRMRLQLGAREKIKRKTESEPRANCGIAIRMSTLLLLVLGHA